MQNYISKHGKEEYRMRENKKLILEEHCKQILEKNGGKIANLSNRILLQDPSLKTLKPPLEFIARNWRDSVTPAMMALACKAAGGKPERTENSALSLSLMNLSFYIWDDIIDKAPHKKLKPTLYGKYGPDIALIIGGIATAKAFTILSQNQLGPKKQERITSIIWNLWTKMANVESTNLEQRKTKSLTSRKALWKIKTEAAADLRACLEIGATIGNATPKEVKHIGKYGQNLAIIHELWKDFLVATNFTLELRQNRRIALYSSESARKLQKN
jgi:geranylgeranyl diphosphate synthase type II